MADEEETETVEDEEPEKGTKPERADNNAALKAALKKANNEAAKYRKQSEQLAHQIEEAETSSKSDMEKLMAKLDAMEERASKAERKALTAEVAEAKGLTQAQAHRLQGSTREELEADADELLEAFAPTKEADTKSDTADDDKNDEQTATGEDTKSTNGDGAGKDSSRPKETLRPGAAPDSDDEPDPEKLAESILKRNTIL